MSNITTNSNLNIDDLIERLENFKAQVLLLNDNSPESNIKILLIRKHIELLESLISVQIQNLYYKSSPTNTSRNL